jgi:hypothetical protein
MVRYLTADQRAIVRQMLDAGEPTSAIASAAGCSMRHSRKLKALHEKTGEPFPETQTRFNALVVTPSHVQVGLTPLAAGGCVLTRY